MPVARRSPGNLSQDDLDLIERTVRRTPEALVKVRVEANLRPSSVTS
jgi:hypothetical protein